MADEAKEDMTATGHLKYNNNNNNHNSNNPARSVGTSSFSSSTECEPIAVSPTTTTTTTTNNNANPDRNNNNNNKAPVTDPENAAPVESFEEYPGLPRLNYRILDYKVKLGIVVFLLVAESALIPISLYYALTQHTTLRLGITFAIITAFFGLVTGIEFGLRCLKLILKGDKYRPKNGTKWSFDFTHWTLSFGYTVMTGILIGASIPHNPLVRPLAIPVPLFLIQVGSQLVWTGWMNKTRRPAPCNISSVEKGERVPPLVFTIIEDIVGVDGGGGAVYRRSFIARYKASWRFRRMIAAMNWFWAVGALIDGIGTMVVIWTVPEAVAYGVGWGSPLIFVTIWTIITIQWVRRDLREEKRLWAEEHRTTASSTEMQQTM